LPIEEKYKALLRLCVKLTHTAYRVTDEDIDGLRSSGLTDEEILEGVFVACQFNAIDRLADTLGLYELMQLREFQRS
jgi:alkylhydroperoxidase family enzyme